jgi:actin related protein 2/3 complex, subunit 5
VFKALLALGQKDSDVIGLLDTLDLDEADTLMKYVYRGLATPDNSAYLLKLHGQLVEKCGSGSLGIA